MFKYFPEYFAIFTPQRGSSAGATKISVGFPGGQIPGVNDGVPFRANDFQGVAAPRRFNALLKRGVNEALGDELRFFLGKIGEECVGEFM